MQFPSKLQWHSLDNQKNITPKFQEAKEAPFSQRNPKHKKNAGKIKIPEIKLHCRAIAIKTAFLASAKP
jgi:sortase (surface protein transpeptidase)